MLELAIATLIALALVGVVFRLRRVPDTVCPMCKDEIHQGGYEHRGVVFCSEPCAAKDWEFQTGW